MDNVVDFVISINKFEQQWFVLKCMLQSPRLKYHMNTIGIDQSLSNSALFEHRWLQNINKSYKLAGKWNNHQQFKYIIESTMVSTTYGFADNSIRYPITPTPIKKPSARKSLCLFTNLLDVRKNYFWSSRSY